MSKEIYARRRADLVNQIGTNDIVIVSTAMVMLSISLERIAIFTT